MATYPQYYAQKIPQKRRYFVILVHFGKTTPTQACVDAWLAGHIVPEEIIIIDHNPQPLTLRSDPRVAVYRPVDNFGFAAGVNTGLGVFYSKKLKADDVVIVMNNDIAVNESTLSELAAWWPSLSRPALVGVPLLEAGRPVFGGRINFLTGRAEVRHDVEARPHYIHGAMMAADYATWLSLKGLPEKYFMYWEDAALGFKARHQKIALVVADITPIKHDSASSLNQMRQYYLIRNGAMFMQNETELIVRWWWFVYNRLRLAYHSLKRPRHAVVIKALSDAIAGVDGQVSNYE